jgi:signal transduction histidine kinase
MLTTEQSDGTPKGFRASQNVNVSPIEPHKRFTINSWRTLLNSDRQSGFINFKFLALATALLVLMVATEGMATGPRAASIFVGLLALITINRLVEFGSTIKAQKITPNLLTDTLEHMPHGLAHWDAKTRLVWSNNAYRELMGLEEADVLVGTTYASIMTAAKNPSTFAAEKDDELHRVVSAKCADGKTIRIEDVANADQNFVSVITDQTEFQRSKNNALDLEQQCRELAQQYQEEKIAAEAASRSKTSFLSHLSHDMRTPLNHIIGFADLVLHQPYGEIGDKRYTNYVSDIKRSGETLLDSFASIFELAELEGGRTIQRPTTVDTYQFVQNAKRRHEARAERAGIELASINLSDDNVKADEHLIKRMVDNLIDNAIRFTPEGGKVILNCWGASDGVVLEITDSGIGISNERMALLTQPFVLGESAFTKEHNGLGLGIATSRAIAELSGGKMDIKSSPGIGTTVAITLPLMTEEATLEKVA